MMYKGEMSPRKADPPWLSSGTRAAGRFTCTNQGTIREQSGNNQGTIREQSGKNQGRIRENQGRIREESGKNQGKIGEQSGNNQGTIREQSPRVYIVLVGVHRFSVWVDGEHNTGRRREGSNP
jgi:hypothetical protein